MAEKPLVVDLDGTLIMTDLLHESALRLLKTSPWALSGLAFALVRGKAATKHHIATRTDLDPATLPYHADLLRWLSDERARGRRLVLCTAANDKFAREVAAYLGLFDEVMASDEEINLGGKSKAEALCRRFGRGGFDYAGNAVADLPIWKCAAAAIVVNGSSDLSAQVSAICPVTREFPRLERKPLDWFSLLRIQQWLKNLLLFAPVLAAHEFVHHEHILLLVAAMLSFSLSASATYLVNDLLDLDSDRIHPRKRARMLASGRVPIGVAVVAIPVLMSGGLLLAWQIGQQFLICLLAYLLITLSYSWKLKRLILVDCITLAVLYTLRIIAGAAAVGMGLSFWLLAFAVFLFLSLAFVKRYAELEVQLLEGRDEIHGRGYLTSDAPIVQTLGISAGYAAALVFSLYLNSEEILFLYATPEIVWGAVLILLYWISWMWMQAHRGLMHDDPLVFAVKDRTSLLAGALFLLVVYLGTVEVPW